MNIELDKYLYDDPQAYWFSNGKRLKQSIHGKSYERYKKAKFQAEQDVKNIDEIISIIKCFLDKVGIQTSMNPFMSLDSINYLQIKENFELEHKEDIVWLKFTKDKYLGVVAVSDDINFQVPNSENDYDLQHTVFNDYTKKYETEWVYNASGIIIHKLGKEWDTSFVLVFPLKNIPRGYKRGDVEKAIGNLLLEKEVPILDCFSHLY